jgi:hypothetical protein
MTLFRTEEIEDLVERGSEGVRQPGSSQSVEKAQTNSGDKMVLRGDRTI